MSNIVVLASGGIAARIVPLIVVPLLTRIYSPSDFGVLALFAACISVLQPLMTFRYHVALPLPRTRVAAFHLIILSSILTIIMLALLSVAMICFGEDVFDLLSIEAMFPHRWWLLAGLGGTATYEILQFWFLREKQVRRIAFSQIIQSLAGSGAKVIGGLLGLHALGLIVGQIVQQAGGVSGLLMGFLREIRSAHYSLKIKRVFLVAIRYKGFPISRLPSQFLMVATVQAPLFFATSKFGPEVAGQFALAFTTLAVPVALLSQTVGNAYYAEIAKLGASQSAVIKHLSIAVMKRLAIFAFFPVFILAVYGPVIFSSVFGSEWQDAGEFAQILSAYLFFQIVTTPVMHVLTVYQKHAYFLYINISRAALVVGIFTLCNQLGLGSKEVVCAYTIVLIVHYSLTARKVFGFLSAIGDSSI